MRRVAPRSLHDGRGRLGAGGNRRPSGWRGSLYERYYGIDYTAIAGIHDTRRRRFKARTSDAFDRLCLYFVGRSLDSMFDLLGGALAATGWRDRLHRVSLSFQRPGRRVGNRWRQRRLTGPQLDRARQILTDSGLDPSSLARRDRPATFVDVVHGGSTFSELFGLLRPWVDQQRQPWNAVRGKLRFVGVTSQTKTSPNTFRWQQHAWWTTQLPARAVRNAAEQVLAADHPHWAKRLGRQVRGFDEHTWQQTRFGIVVTGSVAKFAQHDDLRRYLLGTGDRILVEASPHDRIWGIGLSADDERAARPD